MTTFTTDDYFHIGQMHLIQGKPCQDYAFSSVYGSVGFAVVSDGCSSGRHTDIGSRVIALVTAAAVKRYIKLSLGIFPNILKGEICHQQENTANLIKEALSLGLEDMLATCGYICFSEAGGFVHLRGDGAIAIAERDGNIRLISYRWDKNTPFYPAYANDDYKKFIDFHGGDSSAGVLRAESWKFTSDKLFAKEKEELVSVNDGIAGAFHEFSAEEIKKLSFIAVFTDGVMQVGSIVSGGSDFLDWKEVVTQMMSFKNSAGEFAKRRAIRFLKDQQKNGKLPLDDIAYAVVKINTEEDN